MTSSAVSPGSRCIEPLLALNAAEERLQLVLGARKGVGGPYTLLHCQEWATPGEAARFLAPAIDYALKAAGVAPASLAGLASVRGPGGFTGLRLVLSTALGLAKACDLPLAGLDYLPLLARQAVPVLSLLSGDEAKGCVFAITHARSNQVHIQGFVSGQSEPPLAVDLETAAALVASGPGPRVVCGSGARRHREFFTARWGREVVILDASYEHPRPESLLAAAAAADYRRAPIEPLYLRPSDAEANIVAIAAKTGQDPEQMARRLAELTSS